MAFSSEDRYFLAGIKISYWLRSAGGRLLRSRCIVGDIRITPGYCKVRYRHRRLRTSGKFLNSRIRHPEQNTDRSPRSIQPGAAKIVDLAACRSEDATGVSKDGVEDYLILHRDISFREETALFEIGLLYEKKCCCLRFESGRFLRNRCVVGDIRTTLESCRVY
jgi:hypothetical protein